MSVSVQIPVFVRVLWRWLRAPVWLAIGAILGFLAPYLVYLDAQVRDRFDALSWDLPSRVYARSLELRPGSPMSAEALLLELDAARYTVEAAARTPGTFAQEGSHFIIARRAFADTNGREPIRRISLTLNAGAVSELIDADSKKPLTTARLDPARIATLYGPAQEERRIARLEQLPPLLVTGLQAVEDRDFAQGRLTQLEAALDGAAVITEATYEMVKKKLS